MTIHKYDFDARFGAFDRAPDPLPYGELVSVLPRGMHPPKGWGGLRRFRHRWMTAARSGLLLGLVTVMMASALAFGSLIAVLVMAMLALRPPP